MSGVSKLRICNSGRGAEAADLQLWEGCRDGSSKTRGAEMAPAALAKIFLDIKRICSDSSWSKRSKNAIKMNSR